MSWYELAYSLGCAKRQTCGTRRGQIRRLRDLVDAGRASGITSASNLPDRALVTVTKDPPDIRDALPGAVHGEQNHEPSANFENIGLLAWMDTPSRPKEMDPAKKQGLAMLKAWVIAVGTARHLVLGM